MKDYAIEMDHVDKDFKIYHHKSNLFADKLFNSMRGRNKYETLQVLKDISLQIRSGEMIGIIGRNGAGKTTLLKILAGIIKPTHGSVKINGKLTPFLELGVGFNQDLTAIDNIILYGTILGFSRKQIMEKVPLILQYAELEKFGDIIIKNFSSGMKSRLAFSTAAMIDPDILLVDEVLAVGDYAFQQKSFNTFMEMKKKKKTIIFVSHSLEQIRKLCDVAILLNDGKIETMGDPNTVVKKYLEIYYQSNTKVDQIHQNHDFELDRIFPDNSTFLKTTTDGSTINRLRWRTKALIEDNLFAIKEKSILDLGSHDGRFVYASIKCGATLVDGIEWREDLVDISNINLEYYGINKSKYSLTKGDVFMVAPKIKPQTYDTIFCFGLMSKVMSHADLIGIIARLKPSYIILDTEVTPSIDSVISVVFEDSRLSHNTIRGDNVTGIPSKSALELLLSMHKLKFGYIDWHKLGISDWAGLEDYRVGNRVSMVITLDKDQPQNTLNTFQPKLDC